MTGYRLFVYGAVAAGLMTLTACGYIFSQEKSIPASHEYALGEGVVACTECHQDELKGAMKPYESFNHSPLFVKNHRYYASRDDRLCATCHAGSFCNDCHTNEVEMKPSIKYGYRPDRDFMHRGDFLTRHKIDGKIDPVSCYRCHGRSNNEQCVVCHR